MTLAVQSFLFFRRKMLESLRQPAWIIMGLMTPLLYLGLFTPLLNSLAGGLAFRPATYSTCSCRASSCSSRSARAWGPAGRSSGSWTRG